MADYIRIQEAASGTDTAADEVGGVKITRVKACFGEDGSFTDVSPAAPLPTTQTGALPAGTNAIGKLAANDGVDIGDVTINNASIAVNDGGGTVSIDDGGDTVSIDDGGGSVTVDGTVAVSSAPARARATDTISAALATDAIMSGTTALTPTHVKISAASSGNNTLVAAVTSKKIRVLQVVIVAAAAVDIKFQSGAGGTDLTGLMSLDEKAGFSASFTPIGWFETASNTLLNLNLSSAVQCSGFMSYVEVS